MARNLYASLLALCLGGPLFAGHYSGGNITWSCQLNNTYDVTLQLFVDCSGTSIIPQTLSFSSTCGTSFTVANIPASAGVEVSQLCPAQLGNSTCNGGNLPGMRLYEFNTQVTLPPCDSWTVSWNICCRAASINLVGVPGMYLEATINNSSGSCDNSPVFAEDALPYVCVNQPVSYNFGLSDPESDSLAYAFINARFFNGAIQNVTYSPGYSGASPIPGITLDAATGQVQFTPTSVGYYVVVVQANAYNAAGELTGTVMRDIVFVVINCANNNPDGDSGEIDLISGQAQVAGPHELVACGGSAFCFNAAITDADASQTLTLESNVADVLPGADITVTGTNPATALICWDAAGASPGTYAFTITATDDACPQPASQIITYTVTVADAPYAGTNVAATYCGDAPPNLFGFLDPAADDNGSFTLVSPNVYTYVVPAVGDCPADSSTLTLNPDAGLGQAINVCANGDAVLMIDSLLGTPQNGGAWIAPNNTSHSNSFDPSTDPSGVYCYTVQGTPPCANATACLSITVVDANETQCLNTGIVPIRRTAASLYPNPSSGHLRLSGTNGAFRVEIIDSQGRLVHATTAIAPHEVMDILLPASLPSAPYVLRYFDGAGRHTLPFDLVR
jgi:hypothetical protein